MKLLHRDVRQYGILMFLICYAISLILHGLVILILIPTDLSYSFIDFWYIDVLLAIVLFLGIWKYVMYRWFKVTPSASFAYVYDDGPWINWREDPKTSITIHWFSKKPTKTKLLLGTNKEEMKPAEFTNEDELVKMHYITIEELQPNTKYYYQILEFPHDNNIHSFKTAPNEHQPFKFIVLGDTQNGGGLGKEGWTYPTLIQTLLKHKNEISMYLHAGDFMDQGNDLRSWHAMWKTSREILPEIPLFISIGNHDGGTQYNNDPNKLRKYPDEGANFDYFLNNKYGKPADEDEITSFKSRYYSIKYSNCIFLFLDTKERKKAEPNNAMYRFIEKELSEVPEYIWKIIVIHRPQVELGHKMNGIYSFKHNYYAKYLLPLFDKHKVDFVFQGHSHNYQNMDWKLTKDSEFNPKGNIPNEYITHYIVTGGSGNIIKKNPPILPDQVGLDGFYYYENSSQYLLVSIEEDKIILESRYAQDDSIMHSKTYLKKNDS